jgi:hypothetical protein
VTGSISLDHQEFNAQGLKKVLHESANTKPALLDKFINLCAFAVPASGDVKACIRQTQGTKR